MQIEHQTSFNYNYFFPFSKEIEEAKKDNKPFDFTHFILISKLHETTRKDAEAKKKKAKGPNILWVNAEEEAITEVISIY